MRACVCHFFIVSLQRNYYKYNNYKYNNCLSVNFNRSVAV